MNGKDAREVQQYRDLGELDQDAYECQRCRAVLQEKFKRGECPVCNTSDFRHIDSEWAKSFIPVDHSPPQPPAIERTVRV